MYNKLKLLIVSAICISSLSGQFDDKAIFDSINSNDLELTVKLIKHLISQKTKDLINAGYPVAKLFTEDKFYELNISEFEALADKYDFKKLAKVLLNSPINKLSKAFEPCLVDYRRAYNVPSDVLAPCVMVEFLDLPEFFMQLNKIDFNKNN